MKRVALGVLSVLGVAALVGGCAYFNALYNAQRLFSEAERAAARGEGGTARASYARSIEKAAKSLRRDPDGRWADDALYLIGRAQFGRGESRAAEAAMRRLLGETDDESMRAGAHAYIGAARVRQADYAGALPALDRAVAADAREDVHTFARLWRARARFAVGDDDAGWADLDAATAVDGVTGRDAWLEQARRAIQGDDPDRARTAFAALFDRDDGHRRATDTLLVLARRARGRWGAAAARTLLEPVEDAVWTADRRNRVLLDRAGLAAEAGDTAAAEREVEALVGRAGRSMAAEARLLLARWRLAGARDLADVRDIRDLLLGGVENREIQRLIRHMKVLAVLVDQGRNAARPLAFFAAAEIARDELDAPRLAHALFLACADGAADPRWRTKAILAAAGLAPSPDAAARVRARLPDDGGDVYLAALRGGGAAAEYEAAERELASALEVLRLQAERRAEREDVLVTQLVTAWDSARDAERMDSLREPCTTFVDSLSLEGIRADSVHAACVRRDTARVDSLLEADTILPDDTAAQRDTGGFPPDTTGLPPDTTGPPPDGVAALLRAIGLERADGAASTRRESPAVGRRPAGTRP